MLENRAEYFEEMECEEYLEFKFGRLDIDIERFKFRKDFEEMMEDWE